MNWTDIFKSKSSKGRLDPRVRWFGKLPAYADYYTSPTDQEWSLEFNDWLLEGYGTYRERLAQHHAAGAGSSRLPGAELVLRLPRTNMTVLASLRDYGGDARGRGFPFCFYVAVPTALWSGPTSSQSIVAMHVAQDLHTLHRSVERIAQAGDGFPVAFGDCELDLSALENGVDDGAWTEDARRISMASWFQGIAAGVKVRDREAWLRLAMGWRDGFNAAEMRNSGRALCLPISTGIPSELQQAGWLEWLAARVNLRRCALSLVMVGGGVDRPGHLAVMMRAPRAEDFLLATALANKLSYVDDLSNLLETDAGRAPGGPSGKRAADWDTWLDFVRPPGASS
jgi:hypothetical protein